MKRLHVFSAVSFMLLAACSSVPSHNEDTSASERQSPTIYHEQRIENGLVGNTIQFWLLDHGLTADHKTERDDPRVNRPIDQPMDRQAEQQLDRPIIQKPDRQVDRPRSQQPVRQLNRPINRQLDRRN